MEKEGQRANRSGEARVRTPLSHSTLLASLTCDGGKQGQLMRNSWISRHAHGPSWSHSLTWGEYNIIHFSNRCDVSSAKNQNNEYKNEDFISGGSPQTHYSQVVTPRTQGICNAANFKCLFSPHSGYLLKSFTCWCFTATQSKMKSEDAWKKGCVRLSLSLSFSLLQFPPEHHGGTCCFP